MSWPKIKLRELITLTGGHAFKSGDFEDSGMPLIRIGTANSGVFKTTDFVFLPQEYKSKYSKYLVMPQDLLITLTGTVGKGDYGNVCEATDVYDSYLLNQRVAKINIETSNLYKRYLYLFLATPEVKINLTSLSRGVRQANIKNDDILDLEIPLPPLDEQKRIAAILDKADSVRRKRQQAINLAGDFLRSVFLDMFGDPVTNPKGWEVKPLVSLCKKVTDGTHHSPPIVENGVPYVTAKHLKSTGLEFHANPWFVSEEEHKKIYARCNPEPNDVLYIKDGATAGLAAINEYDFEFSMLSSLALLKPDCDLITSEFLCMFLNHPRTKLVLTANMAGAAITRLTLAKIKDVKVPLPDSDSQKKFREIYISVRAFLEKVKGSGELSEQEFNSLSQKAFAGEL